jgi:hypothetical protein
LCKTPGSLQINLLFTIYAEQAQTLIASCKLGFSSEDIIAVSLDTNRFGGAERDRTADPLLAKQVLSQLSYSPISSIARINPGSATFRISLIPSSQTLICYSKSHLLVQMVGPGRLELPTPRLSSVCSNQLSYGPIPVPVDAAFVFLKKEKRGRRTSPYPLSA